jgi:hypothetical protein
MENREYQTMSLGGNIYEKEENVIENGRGERTKVNRNKKGQKKAVLWSRSHKEPELLAGAGAGAGMSKFRLRLRVSLSSR